MNDESKTVRAEMVVIPVEGYAERVALGLDVIQADNRRMAAFMDEMICAGEL